METRNMRDRLLENNQLQEKAAARENSTLSVEWLVCCVGLFILAAMILR